MNKILFSFSSINGSIAIISSLVQFSSKNDSKNIWDWGTFERALVLYQKDNIWGFNSVNSKNYESWVKEEKQKRPSEYIDKGTNGNVYILFPIDKEKLSSFDELEIKESGDKIEFAEELKGKSRIFIEKLGKENYHRLMAFIEKFEKKV